MRYSAAATEKPIDPIQFAYNAYMRGQEVHTVRLAGMVKTFVNHRELHILGQLCKKFGHIAVASRRLTKRQRLKYAGNRIEAGRTVFYLFPGQFLPADVGAEIQKEDDVFVYQ